jgi:hypothetical protein
MIRTQVYLDNHQPNTIKALAKTRNRSESEVIREALEIGLRQMQETQKGNASVFLGLAELGKRLNVDLPPDLSVTVDDYLYGDKE